MHTQTYANIRTHTHAYARIRKHWIPMSISALVATTRLFRHTISGKPLTAFFFRHTMSVEQDDNMDMDLFDLDDIGSLPSCSTPAHQHQHQQHQQQPPPPQQQQTQMVTDFRGCSSIHEVIARAASSDESRNVVSHHLGESIFNVSKQTIRMGAEGARAREHNNSLISTLTREVFDSVPANRGPRRSDGIRGLLYEYLIQRSSMVHCGVISLKNHARVRAIVAITGPVSCSLLAGVTDAALKVQMSKNDEVALCKSWDISYSRSCSDSREPWRMTSFVRDDMRAVLDVECDDKGFETFMNALLSFCIHTTNAMERAERIADDKNNFQDKDGDDEMNMNTSMKTAGSNFFGLKTEVTKNIRHRDYMQVRSMYKHFCMYMLCNREKCLEDGTADKMNAEERAWTMVFAFRMLCILRDNENQQSVELLNKATATLYDCESKEITASQCDQTFKTLNVESSGDLVCKSNTAMLMMTQAAVQADDPTRRDNMSSKDAYHNLATHMDTYNAMSHLHNAAQMCGRVADGNVEDAHSDNVRLESGLFPLVSCVNLTSWPVKEKTRYHHDEKPTQSARTFRFGVKRLDWTLFNKEYKRSSCASSDGQDDE